MNRHERRRAATEARRGKFPRRVDTSMWSDYLRHLPRVALDEPEEPGRTYCTVTHHDVRCRSLVTGRPDDDCDCGPLAVTKHVEPRRH
jgi:hypothetical protein